MKKLLLLTYGILCIFRGQSQNLNYTLCPGYSATIIVPNSGNLTNPTYSLNPGAIASSNPTFIVHPSSANTSFTVYITGLNNQSLTVTNQVVYNYSVTPTSTLLLNLLPPQCGSTLAVINATYSSWSTIQPTLNWLPVPFSLNSSSIIATYLNMPVTVSLTSTDPLGCTQTATASITLQQTPYFYINNVSGSNSITCEYPSINLYAVSNYTYNGGILNYFWMSNSATFNTSSVNIVSPGIYTVTGTDPINNCSSTNTVSIGINTVSPISLITPSILSITCSLTSIATTVAAISSPSYNMTHLFISPFGGTLSVTTYSNNYAIYTPMTTGIFTHCLINNISGCSTCKNFTVTSNQGFPTFTLVSPQNFSLGCSTKSVAVIHIFNGNTVPSGGPVSYTLLSPSSSTNLSAGSLSALNTYSINSPGNWIVVARDNSTQCESRVPISILQNTISPNISIVTQSAVITCTRTQIKLEGTSSSPNVSYNWTFLPSGNMASSTLNVVGLPLSPTNTLIGNYTLTVKDTINFCKSIYPVPVYQNLFPPQAKISPINATITCVTPSVVLVNMSTTGIPSNSGFPSSYPVIGYHWLGPNPQQPVNNVTTYNAFVPGIYTLTALDLNNGCSSETTTPVFEGRVFPNILSTPPFLLPCPGMVTLSPIITSPGTGLTYLWLTPPNSIVSGVSSNSITTNAPGFYTITVTNIINNCSSTGIIAVYACVGLQNNKGSDHNVILFPNPTTGVLKITSEGYHPDRGIEIYNSLGQLVKKEKVTEEEHTTNMQNETNGIYVIHLMENNKTIFTSKFIKQ